MKYFLILDIGTTNIKALAFSQEGRVLERMEKQPEVIYPKPGWVEEDPNDVIEIVYALIEKMMGKLGRPLGIGLTNQRSSTVIWDKKTGTPLYNIITWQDTRTTKLVKEYSSKLKVRLGSTLGKILKFFSKFLPFIKRCKKGAYIISLAHIGFGTTHSSLHIRWLMNNVAGVKDKINRGQALFGTLDSWITWNLTGKHVTDQTNASATGLFDPFYLRWSENITDLIGIPRKILPQFVYNDSPIGMIQEYDIPLLTIIADQQASLYMSGVSKGTTNMTKGTGTFIDVNVGETPYPGAKGLYPMVALGTQDKTLYLLEGSVPTSGSALEWLKDIGLVKDYTEISEAFEKEESGVTVIPTFAGVGTPYIRPDVKGAIFGLTRSTSKQEIIRGLITGIAMRCTEVINFMENIANIQIKKIVADGGLAHNDECLQLISDLSHKRVKRPKYLNGSAYGTYMLTRLIYNQENIIKAWKKPQFSKRFTPREYTEQRKTRWKKQLQMLIEMS